MTAVLAGWLVLGAAVLAVWQYQSRHRLLRARLRRRVLVTCKSGVSFAGVLFEADDRSLLLRDAVMLAVPERGEVRVDGEVLVLREDVAYLQIP